MQQAYRPIMEQVNRPNRQLILIAEDDDDFRDYICSLLDADTYGLIPVADGAAAMEYIDVALLDPLGGQFPSLLITDVRMPQCSGLDVLAYAGFIPTIVMTAFGSSETYETARRLGAQYVFDKPFDADDLRTAVEALLERPLPI